MEYIKNILKKHLLPYWEAACKDFKEVIMPKLSKKVLADIGYKIGDTLYVKSIFDDYGRFTIRKHTILEVKLGFCRGEELTVEDTISYINKFLYSPKEDKMPRVCRAYIKTSCEEWMFGKKGNFLYTTHTGGPFTSNIGLIMDDDKFLIGIYKGQPFELLNEEQASKYITKIPKK